MHRTRKFTVGLAAIAAAVGGPLATVIPAHAASIGDTTEFVLPNSSAPTVIVTGPDGNLWFTETGTNKIGRMTPSGTLTEFDVPTASARPNGITIGPDGQIWYTEDEAGKIARITTAGASTEFPLGGGTTNGAEYIVTGPDNNLWVTEGDGGMVDRVTTAGVVDRFPLTVTNNPQGIASAHGLIWVAESDSGQIATVDMSGVVTQHTMPLPAGKTSTGGLDGMTTGPDGNVWFGLDDKDRMATVDASFNFTYYTQPDSSGGEATATGPDGNVWTTESRSNKLGRFTPTGTLTEFPLPTNVDTSVPSGLVSGPDCQLWFLTRSNGSSPGGDRVGRMVVNLPGVTGASPKTGPAAGGTSVTLSGADFYKVTGVTFGGKPAASFTRTGCNTVTATAPAGTGAVDIRVTTQDGTTPISPSDVFMYDVAAASAATPALPKAGVGPSSGGSLGALVAMVLVVAAAVVAGARRRAGAAS